MKCFYVVSAFYLTAARGLRLHNAAENQRISEVPGVQEFDAIWHQHFLSEQSNGGRIQVNPQVRLVIGIFTVKSDREYQDVHRRTWMSHSGVCKAVHGPNERCSVYVSFVIGHSPSVNTSTPFQDGEDVLELDIEENMNKGKSFKYFQTASRLYPWATHIGKMDLDVYPYADKLIDSITLGARPQCFHYIGHCCNGGRGNEFYPHDFKAAFTNTCCRYLQGGFYIMSRALAEDISTDGDHWSINSDGYEDKLSGEAIQNYMRQKDDACVLTWDAKGGFEHHSSRSN